MGVEEEDASVDLEKEQQLEQLTNNKQHSCGGIETAQTTQLQLTMSACDACTSCVKDGKLPTAGRVEVGVEATESLVPSLDSVGIGTAAVVSLKEVNTVKYELPYICEEKSKVLAPIDVAISDDGEIFTESIGSTEKFPISPEKNQSNVETDYGVITIVAMRSPVKKKHHCEKDESIVSDVALSRVVRSDTGVNRCASTVPVIHWTSLGDDHDKKLLALGVFSSKEATADGADDAAAAMDRNPSLTLNTSTEFVDGSEIRTTESQESSLKNIETSVTTSLKFGMILHLESTQVTEDLGSRHSRNSRSTPPPVSPSSHYSAGSGYDKKRLTERLKQRLAQRNQNAAVGLPTKSEDLAILSSKPKKEFARDSLNRERKIQPASRQKCRSAPRLKSESNDDANSDILSRYSRTSELDSRRMVYSDSVTFSGTDDEESTLRGNSKVRLCYRKCVSEVGFTGSLSTRLARSKLSKHHHSHHHRIGILQADGIVYDDALLLRLARQARHGRMQGEVFNSVADDIVGSATGERRHNEVKIHIYDLLTNDSFVEVPYLNCSFPIGQCFKVVNDGCHVLGTGAYHVGVEVSPISSHACHTSDKCFFLSYHPLTMLTYYILYLSFC